MKTKCQVILFYGALCTTVELYLDLDGSVEDQVFDLYGDKIDDFKWKEITPYTQVPTITLFKMYSLEQNKATQWTMKKELWQRGYYRKTDNI